MNFYSFLAVGTGGFIGSIFRYLTGLLIDKNINSMFPYGTLVVNVAGSFILGFIIGATLRNAGANTNWKLFLTTGFCGGFTTFSAFSLESFNLFQQKLAFMSIAYCAASLLLGLAAVAVGVSVGKMVNS
jgi:fluoride exporter